MTNGRPAKTNPLPFKGDIVIEFSCPRAKHHAEKKANDVTGWSKGYIKITIELPPNAKLVVAGLEQPSSTHDPAAISTPRAAEGNNNHHQPSTSFCFRLKRATRKYISTIKGPPRPTQKCVKVNDADLEQWIRTTNSGDKRPLSLKQEKASHFHRADVGMHRTLS